MFRIVLIISVFLLSSCGYHGCIKPQNVMFDEYSSAVETGLQDGKKEHITWVKSDLVLAGKKDLVIRVDTVNINYCHNTKYTVNISANKDGGTLSGKELSGKKFSLEIPNIMAGEKLNFRLYPAFNFTVDKDICSNKNPKIYAQNTDKCIKDYLDTEYYVTIDNYASQMHNLMYLKDSSSHDKARDWINFPTKILYSPGGSDSIYQYLKNQGSIDSADKASTQNNNDEMFYLCATNKEIDELTNKAVEEEIKKQQQQKKSNTQKISEDEKKQLVKKYKEAILKKRDEIRKKYQKQYDAYSVNMICGNLCNIPSYENKKVEKDCFVVEMNNVFNACTVTADGNLSGCNFENVKQYNTALPFLYLKHNSGITNFITVDDTIRKWQSDNNSSSEIGLLTNYGYLISKDILDKGLYLELNVDSNLELIGNYKIEVAKDCTNHVKDSLYYVISKGPPKVKPGESGTTKIDFISNEDTKVTLSDKDASGDLYFGVKDNGDGYENNTGYFNITVISKKKIPNVISYIVEQLKGSLERGLYGTSSTNSGGVNLIYNNIVKNMHFIQIVNSLLVLYVLINALFYFVGFSKASIFELLIITLKIGVIIYVIGPSSWEFFNDHLFKLFTGAPVQLIAIMTGQDPAEATSFEFLDLVLYRFSLSETWIQILALLFTGPVGWVSVALIFWGLIVLFLTIATAIITYLISIILIGLLLSIAPFFIICILFKRTKAIFDAWIKSLVQTAMQPVIIFASFALLTEVIDNIIYSMFAFESCDTCVLYPEFDLGIMKIGFCILEFLLPVGISPLSTFNDNMKDSVNGGGSVMFLGLPVPFMKVLVFVIMVNATKHFIGSTGEMCTSIFGSFANLSAVAENAKESALGIIGMDQNSRMQRERYEEMNKTSDRDNDGERKRDPLGLQAPVAEDDEQPISRRQSSRQSRGGVEIPEGPPSSFGG